MMIPIPESLIFRRNKDMEKKLLARARQKLAGEQRSPGLHASDLLDPRRTYWRYKTEDKERALSDHEVMLFVIGKALHYAVLEQEDEGSLTSDLGFEYSIDKLDRGIPAELKTTRAKIPQTTEPLEQYIEQLLIYMACQNKVKGKLWVLYLNAKDEAWRTSPQFRCATITVTKEDIQSIRMYLKDLTAQIEQVITVDQTVSFRFHPWRSLPLCRKWLCSRQRCEWYDQCQPEGRWKPKKVRKT